MHPFRQLHSSALSIVIAVDLHRLRAYLLALSGYDVIRLKCTIEVSRNH